MRKITTRDQEGKKKRRNQLVLSIVLVFIMFFSVLGYSFVGRDNSNTEKINYNGFEFVRQDNFWLLSVGDLDFIFRYNPNEVEKIYSMVNYLNTYSGEPLYLYSESSEASSEIYTNLNKIVQRTQFACLNEEECDENLPIKTCEDNFVVIREDNASNIIQNKSCVFIYGPQENLTKITDEFLFKIIGID